MHFNFKTLIKPINIKLTKKEKINHVCFILSQKNSFIFFSFFITNLENNFLIVVNNKSNNNKNWSSYGNTSNNEIINNQYSKQNSTKLYTNHYKYGRNLTSSAILSSPHTSSTNNRINSDSECDNQTMFNQDSTNLFNSSNSYDLIKSKNLSYKNSELEEQLTLTPEGSMTPENLD